MFVRDSLLASNELRDLEKKGVYDNIDFSYFETVGDYMNFYSGFVSKDKKNLISNLLDLLSRRAITEKEYELTRKELIATEFRTMENKYKYLKYFPLKINIREDYSEFDFYKSIDYNRFMEIVSSLDFNNYTVGEIKRLTK